MIGEKMNEFTKEETARINYLYAHDFEGITPDDAILIGKFEANKALQEEEFKAKIDAMEQETQANIAMSKEQHELAMQNLQELQERAVARLERIENGI